MDEMDWDAPPADGPLREDALRVEIARPAAGMRLTGRLDAALGRLPGLRMAGYAPDAPPPDVLRLARDKALVLDAPEALAAIAEGWHAEGFAASRCDGAWALLHVTGAAAPAAMAMVAAVDLEAPSPSAAMALNGRTGGALIRSRDGWTLVVPAPHLAFHAAALAALPEDAARPRT